jgi:HlyD family secretion protein
MASPTTDSDVQTSKFSAVLKAPPSAAPPVRRRRLVPRWIVVLVVVASVLGLGVAAAVKSDLLTPATATRQMMIEKVRRADLIVSVTEDGTVESAHNVDIKCEVKGGATILWIIKDGTQVKKDDELVRLDSAAIEDQISQQTINTEKARALMIEAKKTHESAQIAVKEFKEGTYMQQLDTLKVTETVAKENLHSAENLLQFYNRMSRQGYVTSLQRDAQEFAVSRAKLDLGVAEKAIEVLEKFTREKTLVGLEAAEASAEARMKSEEAAYQLEADRLKRYQTQLEKCTVYAPDDGMVVYANDEQRSGRGSSRAEQSAVEEGALMRERQTMIKLPDLSRMQVKCTVHESKVDSLQRGMRARIHIQDHDFQGTVTSVANQAEPSNFFMGNVKEYAAIVSVDSDSNGYGLRPGMTAAVEILIANRKSVLSVPVQAVVEQGGKFYSWVSTFAGPKKHPVVLGMSNNTRIEITDGLKEGDEVLLNPRAMVDEAREDVRSEEAVDVKKRFGGDTPAQLPALNSAAPARRETGKGGRSFDLMSFDKDGDKKVSKDEAPEQVQKAFDFIDTNTHGLIDAMESAAAAAKRRQMEQQGGGPGGPRGPGGP